MARRGEISGRVRIKYTIPLKRSVRLDDHWPIEVMGGQFRPIEENGLVSSVEFAFAGQPLDLSPVLSTEHEGRSVGTITGRDKLLPEVQSRLRRAFAYIQCFFDVELEAEAFNAEYEGETAEERAAIQIHSLGYANSHRTRYITYDFLTRALMRAEVEDESPTFEATLLHAARTELFEKNYIDSFRYSFLLIEAIYGGGQYQNHQLRRQLTGDRQFIDAVAAALAEIEPSSIRHHSDTLELLLADPSPDEVVRHLVSKRGFYFHGNRSRPGAWRPDQQEHAEAVANLAINILLKITSDAAAGLFADELSQQHWEQAKKAGAIMTLKATFTYSEEGEDFDRPGELRMNVPGTKVTRRMAMEAAKNFLATFEHETPTAYLKRVTCTAPDGQPVFDMRFPADLT